MSINIWLGMSEALLLNIGTRRWFRSLQSVRETSWLAWLLVTFTSFLLGDVFFQMGATGVTLGVTSTVPFLEYGLLLIFLLAFWIGYKTINGQRPAAWRQLPKTSWFFSQAISAATRLVIYYLLTVGAYYLGSGWQQGFSWSTQALTILSLILLPIGVTFLAMSFALALKALTHNYLIRTIIFIVALFVLTLAVPDFTVLNQSIDSVFRSPELNSLWLVVLLGVGQIGASVALLDWAFQCYPVSLQPIYQFWQLKLPTKGLTKFSSGTALFFVGLLAAFRHVSFQRRLIGWILVSIALAAVISILAGPVSNATTYTAFLGLLLLTATGISHSLSFALGRASEQAIRAFGHQSVRAQTVRLSFIFAAVAISIVIDSVYLQAFADQFTVQEAALVLIVSILTVLFSFKLGSYTAHTEAITHLAGMQIKSATVMATVFVGLLTFLGLLFAGTVNVAVTTALLGLWTLLFYGYLERATRSLQ